jgi:hypothetical protein
MAQPQTWDMGTNSIGVHGYPSRCAGAIGDRRQPFGLYDRLEEVTGANVLFRSTTPLGFERAILLPLLVKSGRGIDGAVSGAVVRRVGNDVVAIAA